MQPENFKITSFESIKILSKKKIDYLTISTSFKLDPTINLASDLNISTENIRELLFKQNLVYEKKSRCFEAGELNNSKSNRYVLIGFNPIKAINDSNFTNKYKQSIQIDRKTNSVLCAYIIPNNKQINKLYNDYYFAKTNNLVIIDIIKKAIKQPA